MSLGIKAKVSRGCFFLFGVFSLLAGVKGQHLACENRRPEGHNPHRSEGDGDFRIIVVGPHANRGVYSPNEVYTVTIQGLKTRYSTQKFTEFLLVSESEKQAMMGPTGLVTTGIFHIIDDSQTRFSDTCPDGVTSLSRQPKGEVSVLWTAPSTLVASCITFKATVVERPHMWYMDDGALTKTLCPELPGQRVTPAPLTTTTRAPVEIPQQRRRRTTTTTETPPREIGQTLSNLQLPINNQIQNQPEEKTTFEKCCACDEAKYEVIFEGIWSKETHAKDFPENEWLLHFSDIIGASHSPDYFVWRNGEIASEGIRQVAEWGATRHLENELKQKSVHINTIIKARGLWHPNEKGKTSAAFRVDKAHHLMSLVSMIGPSPDWLVGVSALELCQSNCTWLEETHLDLFPFDAGTDSGITYMSPNTPTEPREGIRRLTGTQPNDSRSPFYDPQGQNPMKPFAKIHIRRQRIYPKHCNDTTHTSDASHEVYLSENTEDSNRPECVVTDWTSWSACSVTCGKGLRMRKRNYLLPDKADMFRCDRQLIEKEMCLGVTPTCPPDELGIEELDICAVSLWSDWSPCSVSCGRGSRSRHRTYKNHMGRKKCNVDTTESETCEASPCPANSQLSPLEQSECPLSPWSEWAPCSVSCGIGYQIRSRFLLRPNDEPLPARCSLMELSEQAECIGEYGAECKLSLPQAQEICSLPQETGPCRANKLRYFYSVEKEMCVAFAYGGCKGNRNRFDSLEECNQVCGFMRSDGGRALIAPASSNLFAASFAAHGHENEFLPTSPGYFEPEEFTLRPTTPRDLWTRTTTTERAITMTTSAVTTSTTPVQESEENFNLDLGSAMHRKTGNERETLAQKSGGESLTELSELQIEESGVKELKIDCVVSSWSEWSPCSVSCGLGYRTRARKILIQPQNGGRRCPRKTKKKKACSLAPC